jgi:hypothetical protein
VETIKRVTLTIDGREYEIYVQRFHHTTSGLREGYREINPVIVEISGQKYDVSLYFYEQT